MAQQGRIRGVNFDGSVRLGEEELSVEVIEFASGAIYRFSTTPDRLADGYRQFLVIKRLSELYDQLIANHLAFVAADQRLILPIDVQYRGRTEPLNVELPLERVQVEDEKQLSAKYLREIERMSRESLTLDRFRERAVQFKPDLKNPNIKSFEVVAERGLVRCLANNAHTFLSHAEPLTRTGIQAFRVRVAKTYAKNIILGVCGGDIRYSVNNYHSPYFLGLFLSERTILGNSKSDVAIQPIEIVEGRSVLKVEADMNKSVLSWFLDDGFLCARKIPTDILAKDVYPVLTLYNQGDAIELL